MASELDELREKIAGFGTDPYLVTITDSREPHCGTVEVAWDGAGERIVVGAPSSWPGSAAGGLTDVSLLWPPDVPGGYSLIVDGTAASHGQRQVAITVSKAVLHRRGERTPANTSTCASDCIPIIKR